MPDRIGKYTLHMQHAPKILGYAAVAGRKESQGPLGDLFDQTFDDTRVACKTWEQAEAALQGQSAHLAIAKAGLQKENIDVIFAGDLLNQCISSTFGLLDLDIPFLGQYGACSTMAQTLCMAGIFTDCGAAKYAAAVTSSHFCSAERQFRLPLEYGGQRTPTAQWTATASGAAVVGLDDSKPIAIHHVTIGKITDLGIQDAANMGAAMAPAAATTLYHYFIDTDTSPADYDGIFTGDLGHTGTILLRDLLARNKIDLGNRHNDCGLMLFNREEQDVHAGGSGCGCSASVLCSHILQTMERGELKNVLFVATGALMSPTSSQQNLSIPGIAHLVHLVNEKA